MQWLLARLHHSRELGNDPKVSVWASAMTNSHHILGLQGRSSEAVFETGQEGEVWCVRNNQQQHICQLHRHWPQGVLRGWVLSEGRMLYNKTGSLQRKFFFCILCLRFWYYRWEHLLPSTKVAWNLNAQGLPWSVAQFINWSITAALYQGPDPAVTRETKTQLKVSFASNCRIQPLMFTSELLKVGGGSREASQVLTLTLVQWDYLLA